MGVIAIADTRELRGSMVAQLKQRGFEIEAPIEQAFRTVPREVFLPGVALERVYSGDNIITKRDDEGRPMSSSSEVGIMMDMAQLLDVAPGQRILEIGAGTGYNAAILSHLVGERGAVTTVDIDPEVAAQARENLAAAGVHRVAVIAGDGWEASSANASYDRVEVTASVSDLSPSWVAELTDGGRIVFPFVLPGGMQTVIALRKQGAELVSTGVTPGGFMRLRGQGGARSRTRTVDGFDIEMSDGLAEDADETLAVVLRTPSRFAVAPPLGWDALTLLALLHGNVSVSKRNGTGFTVGIFDPRGSLALVELARDSIAGPFSVVLLFGSEAARAELMTAIEEVRTLRLRDLRVVAKSAGSPEPTGDVVLHRGSFTFAFTAEAAGVTP
jgi:protein-L-isoaspartate(D-aspartate) O-methyltransferase